MDIDDISWEPLKPGGASFQLYQIEAGNDRIRLRRSAAFVRFVLFFVVFLAVIPSFLGVGFLVQGKILQGTIFSALALAVIGSFTLWYRRGKYLDGGFDFTNGRWRIGYLKGGLKEIRAIQVLGELVPKNKYRWTHSYEVNLIFDGGRRINVIDHGHEESAMELAETLGSRLQIPVWSRNVR